MSKDSLLYRILFYDISFKPKRSYMLDWLNSRKTLRLRIREYNRQDY